MALGRDLGRLRLLLTCHRIRTRSKSSALKPELLRVESRFYCNLFSARTEQNGAQIAEWRRDERSFDDESAG